MKYVMASLVFLGCALSFNANALKQETRIGCTRPNQVPEDFVNKCALAGGSEVRCSGNTPMCCRKEGDTTHCYDNIDDMKRGGRPGARQPGGSNRLAPPGAPKTPAAPKQAPPPGKLL